MARQPMFAAIAVAGVLFVTVGVEGAASGATTTSLLVRLGDRIGSLRRDEAAALRRVITEMYGE